MANQETTASMLTERAQHLLKVLVECYIESGQPVGSRTLARTAGLNLSPATIRNVMADLEDLGLIVSPHTSAGRIPTAQGYRLFVDTLLSVKPPDSLILQELQTKLGPDQDAKGLVESASSMLSAVTQMAGVVTVPRRDQSALRQIEFLPLSERRILAIMVTNEKEVQNKILHLEREFSPAELRQAANYLNEMFSGKGLGAVRDSLLRDLDAVRADMNRMMVSAIELGGQLFSTQDEGGDNYVLAGEANLMDYQELSDIDKLRQLFDAFKQKREILHLLDKSISAEGVQIFIGQESGYSVFDDCSVVSAPYAVDGRVLGVLGVIGPTRMAYERVIPIVDITAKLLGAALKSRN
jgi:heat-inducible transcriptional repressor